VSELERAVHGEVVQNGKTGSKFTPAIRTEILKHAAKGMSQKTIAPLAGIHPATLGKWLQLGARHAEEEIESDYLTFAIEFLKAQAEYKIELVAEWRKIAEETKQWAGLATLAERLFGDEFGKPDAKQNVNVNVTVGVLEQRVQEADKELVYTGG
jgi:hypothetical protein